MSGIWKEETWWALFRKTENGWNLVCIANSGVRNQREQGERWDHGTLACSCLILHGTLGIQDGGRCRVEPHQYPQIMFGFLSWLGCSLTNDPQQLMYSSASVCRGQHLSHAAVKTLSCHGSSFSAFILALQLAILFCVSYPHTCCPLTGHAPGEDMTFHPDQSPFPTLYNVWVLTSRAVHYLLKEQSTWLRAVGCVVLAQELPQASDWLNLNFSLSINVSLTLNNP